MPEDRPVRKGILDEMDELERKRKAKTSKKAKDDGLDLSKIK